MTESLLWCKISNSKRMGSWTHGLDWYFDWVLDWRVDWWRPFPTYFPMDNTQHHCSKLFGVVFELVDKSIIYLLGVGPRTTCVHVTRHRVVFKVSMLLNFCTVSLHARDGLIALYCSTWAAWACMFTLVYIVLTLATMFHNDESCRIVKWKWNDVHSVYLAHSLYHVYSLSLYSVRSRWILCILCILLILYLCILCIMYLFSVYFVFSISCVI